MQEVANQPQTPESAVPPRPYLAEVRQDIIANLQKGEISAEDVRGFIGLLEDQLQNANPTAGQIAEKAFLAIDHEGVLLTPRDVVEAKSPDSEHTGSSGGRLKD